MDKPTKENTLYLPIKQVYFDQIIEGTKVEEFREIKETTAKKYTTGFLNPETTDGHSEYYIDSYNGGRSPHVAKPYKYLSLAIGYAKERDTALVSVDGIRFIPECIHEEDDFCIWVIAYHIGEVIEVHRKKR